MNLVEAYKKVRPAVVALAEEIEDSNNRIQYSVFASGVCVDPLGIFITAKHCVVHDNFKSLEDVDFKVVLCLPDAANRRWNAYTIKPRYVGADSEQDVCYLIALNEEKVKWPFIKITQKMHLQEGQDVGCAGFPVTSTRLNINPNVFSGIISRIDPAITKSGAFRPNIVLDMCLHRGNSGGPVFNADGELVAIVSGQETRKWDKKVKGMIVESETEQMRVWTNLIHCVPSLEFQDSVDKMKKYYGIQ
jgi:S1-C subfamily serine protease